MNRLTAIPFTWISVLSGIVLILMTSSPLAATDLPAASYYETASRQGVGPYNDAYVESHNVGSVSVPDPAYPPLPSAVATTGVSQSADGSLNPFVSAATSYPSYFSGDAQAEITYSFEILGPAGAQVPLIISMNGSNAFESPLGPDSFGEGGFSITDPLTNVPIFSQDCSLNPTWCSSVKTVREIPTNQVLTADLFIHGASGRVSSQISLDETFAIDSSNAVPGATLAFSPNLVVSTPEPHAFLLVLAGVMCIAFARVRLFVRKLIAFAPSLNG